MKNSKFLFILLLTAVAIVSCSKDPNVNLTQLITPFGATTFSTANNGGNVTCNEVTAAVKAVIGCADFAGFEYTSGKIDYTGGTGGTVGPITWTTDGTYVSWSSALPVKIAVIVKGGSNARVYFSGCEECVTEGSGLSAPINQKNGKPYGLSNITFCYSLCEGGNNCQTAFALKWNPDHRKCFLDLGFHRWGWTNELPGPTSESYKLPIYAGAAQCDLDKGTYVGQLEVIYYEGVAKITFEMEEGYTMDETQVYIGTAMLPQLNGEDTVAPGHYGNQHDLTNATTDYYEISDLPTSGPVWIIAHAVVCGKF